MYFSIVSEIVAMIAKVMLKARIYGAAALAAP